MYLFDWGLQQRVRYAHPTMALSRVVLMRVGDRRQHMLQVDDNKVTTFSILRKTSHTLHKTVLFVCADVSTNKVV